jgi:sugar lactone lactonase YvrE
MRVRISVDNRAMRSPVLSRLLHNVMFLLVTIPGAAAVAQQVVTTFPASTTVNQSSSPLSVMVTMSAGGVATTPAAWTPGMAGGEFSVAAGGTCSAGTSYTPGQQCSVEVVFQPMYPGRRQGAVVVSTSGGTVLGTALVAGLATGGLPVLAPGRIDTVAGDADWIYTGDGGQATKSPIFLPTGVVEDAAGNLYLSDSQNNRIRRVDAQTGTISTIAGTGSAGYQGDGVLATQTEVNTPAGLVLDGAGNLYFADTGNHIVRRIDAFTGILTTVAGTPGVQGYTGDGGAATQARLSFPQSVAFDGAGNLVIADTENNVVRRVDAGTGAIETIVGTGTAGYNGDAQAATSAQLNSPWSVVVGQDGSVYIADLFNNRVRKVSPGGTISTVAGTATRGFEGDGGAAAEAELSQPTALALDPAGDLYIADSDNNRVREVNAVTGWIETICGTSGEQFVGDAEPANLASLYGPDALYFDANGNLFVADMFHNRVREISGLTTALVYPTMKVGKISAPQLVSVANDGNTDLLMASPGLVNAATDAGTTTCSSGADVAAAGTCVVGAEFAPTVTGNPVLGSITVKSNATSTAPVISLSGEVLSITPTTIVLVSSKNPSLLGASVTFTATVDNGSSGAMSGTVVFLDGSTQLCSVTIASNAASCATAALTLGQHSVTAVYSGDANDAAATSSALTQVVQQTATLTLSAAPNPAVVTASVTMTFTATATTGTPSGTAAFYDGTTALGAVGLSGAGFATFSTAQLLPGTHSLSVQYAGDALDAAGKSNTVSLVVQQATTATTLATSNATVPVGTQVTFTATVTCGNGPAPTGSVTFTDGSVTLGTGTVGSGGTATFSTSSLTPGAHTIVATYGGSTDDSGSSSAALTETIQQIGTATTLAADKNPVAAGATVNLTAAVAMVGGPGPVALSGKVNFSEGSTVYGSVSVDNTGHATLPLSSLTAGSHSLVANYRGSTDYAPSSSAALVEGVNSTATSTALSSTATTTYAGAPASFTAAVTSSTGTPTGSVTFTDGSSNIGQGALNAQGVASFSTSTLSVGAHTLTATYGGDGSYNASTSTSLLHTIVLAPTTTALTSSANPSTLGVSVSFTATVSSSSPSPGGSVSFLDGTTALGSATVGSNGTATLSTNTLTFGSHSITAVYQGDGNHATSTSAVLNEKVLEPATAALSSSVNPAIYGNSFVLTAHIGGTGSLVPTGSVVFSDGGSTLGTATLDATGKATFTPATMAVGSHSLSVSYGGDGNYSAAAATLVETIQNASTQISLTASANPATYQAAETFSAAVTGNGGAATGTVTFTDGGSSIGTGLLSGAGVATLTVSTLAPGTHSIVANYAGNGNIGASSSTPLTVTVKETTTMSLASNADPALTLAAFTLTADVMNAGVGVPTGTVTFLDGSTQLGTATIDGTGHAALSVASMSAGSHALSASYVGDGADFAGVSPTLTETVQLRPTTVALTGSSTDPNNAQQVTLIAVVGWSGPVAPTGTVTFTSGSAVLGSAPVGSIGIATLTVTLSSASASVVAAYGGDVSYAGSASSATTISVGLPTQLTMLLDPAAMTFASGQHGSGSVTLVSQSGFADTMALGCLGLPFAATCTFSKTQVDLAANGTTTVKVTVDTGDPLGAGGSAAVRRGASGVMVCFLPLVLLLGAGGWRRRLRLPKLLLVVCAAVMTLGAMGCSGLHINSTPPGTYSFKVTATGVNTGMTESQTMTLTVTQ